MTRPALGRVLVALGLSGLLLFGTVATFLVRATADGGAWRSMSDRIERTLDEAAATARSADAALASTSASTERVAALLGQLATTLRAGSAALQVTILGSQPFAEVAAGFGATADRASAASAEVATTATGVETTRASIAALAGDLAGMASDARQLTAVGDGIEAVAGWRWLGVLVAAWLAACCIVMTSVGLRMGRTAAGRAP